MQIALGAKRSDLWWLVLLRGLRITGVGLGGGLASSFAVGMLMRRLLFETSGTDPGVLGAVCIVLTGVGALASWGPARRPMKSDPLVLLRGD